MLNEIHFWTPSWPVHDLHILLCQKSNCVRCCVGHGIVLDIHKVSSKNARRPGMHTITEKSDVALVSIHHHHFASSSMVDGTPYHDWVATVTICGLKARIYQSPSCLQHTRSQPSLWNSVKWDSSLKTQCLQCPRFHFLCILLNTRRHCLWSKVNLGHLAGSLDWWPAHAAARACLQSSTVTTSFKIGGSSPCTDKEPRWTNCPWPFGSTVCCLGLWSTSMPHWCGLPVSRLHHKFCKCILATHPTFLTLLSENSPQATILQYAPVFALANYMAWRLQRMIENSKWFIKRHIHRIELSVC